MWREQLGELRILYSKVHCHYLCLVYVANQIVMVCALLINFQPVLIPLLTIEESDVDEYQDCYYVSNSDETRGVR